jgi:O-6-methylguanine DNA methyltransferase
MNNLFAQCISTPLGDMLALANETQLEHLSLIDTPLYATGIAALEKLHNRSFVFKNTDLLLKVALQLQEYLAAARTSFEIPLQLKGTTFQQSVWDALIQIPYGSTRSYQQQAKLMQQLLAIRAIAKANGANPIMIIVPCHRIIGSDGSLTGYAGGMWRKSELLKLESANSIHGTQASLFEQ